MRSRLAAGVSQVDVGIKVGPVQKVATVFGDRYWVLANGTARRSRTGQLVRSSTRPGRTPSAGGTRSDRHQSVRCSSRETRSGLGSARHSEGTAITSSCPNIEDPAELIEEYGRVVTPCGFGFTSPRLAAARPVCRNLRRRLEQEPEPDAPDRFRPAVLQRRGTWSHRARLLARRRGGRCTQRDLSAPTWRSVCRVFRRRGASSSCAASVISNCRPTSTL